MSPRHGPMLSRKTLKSFDKNTLKRLLNYFGAYKALLAVVVVCVLISAIASAASSLFLRTLIDDYITPLIGVADPDMSGLLHAIFRMCLLLASGIVATLAYSWIMAFVAQRTMERMRNDMFAKMQRLPIRYFDSHEYGDVMSLYTNDVDTLRQMMSQTFTAAVSSFFTLVTVFVSMLTISVWLTILMVLGIFCVIKIAGFITGLSGPYFMKQQTTLAALDGYVEEIINGEKVVKVFGYENKAKEEMQRRNKAWEEAAYLSNGHAMAMMPIMNGFGYLQYIVVALVGAAMAIGGVTNLSLSGFGPMTVGMIASFLTLARNFTMPVTQISSKLNAIITALAGAARIFALMDEPDEIDDGSVVLVNVTENADGSFTESERHTGIWAWKRVQNGSAEYRRLRGDVRLEHVNFGYTPAKQILHDITLYAKPGQKVAFVGATGAGKTTITNLINRFYDIDDGTILYDGIDIKKIRKNDLRRSLGIVLQDVNLFTGSVMENIRYGNPAASDEECIAAAKLANADSFIRMLPQGYDTRIGDTGVYLSGGEAQRICVARAILKNAPILVLDEATAFADPENEYKMQMALQSLIKGKTVIVIAHRLSSVVSAGRIIVMKEGRMAQCGKHEVLSVTEGVYKNMWDAYTSAYHWTLNKN